MRRAAIAVLLAACADQAAPAPAEPEATAVEPAPAPAPPPPHDGWSFQALVTHAIVSDGAHLSPWDDLGDEVAVYLVTRYGAVVGGKQLVDVSVLLDGETGRDFRHVLGRHEIAGPPKPFGTVEAADQKLSIAGVTYDVIDHGSTLAVWIDGKHEITAHLEGVSKIARPAAPVGGRPLERPELIVVLEDKESVTSGVRHYAATLRVGDTEGPLGQYQVHEGLDSGWSETHGRDRLATRSYGRDELAVGVVEGDVVAWRGTAEIARVRLPERAQWWMTIPGKPSPPKDVLKKRKVDAVVQPIRRIDKPVEDLDQGDPDGVEGGEEYEVGGVVDGVPAAPPSPPPPPKAPRPGSP